MSVENLNAIELSDAELDTVAGGAITISNPAGYASDAGNDFFQKNLLVAQKTEAGPGGSATGSVVGLSEIFSQATQGIAVY